MITSEVPLFNEKVARMIRARKEYPTNEVRYKTLARDSGVGYVVYWTWAHPILYYCKISKQWYIPDSHNRYVRKAVDTQLGINPKTVPIGIFQKLVRFGFYETMKETLKI